MASHVQTVTRQTITRKPLDLDPKIIAVAVIAAVTIAVLVALYFGQVINLPALLTGSGGALLAPVAGYVKRSSHGALVEEVADDARAIANAAAPVVSALVPEAAPVATDVEEAVDELASAFSTGVATPTSR